MATDTTSAGHSAPFITGAIVVVSLSAPREKFWGALLALAPAGVSIRGLDIASLDEAVRTLRRGEAAEPATIFFPMHRVERIELDVAVSGIPAVGERISAATSRDVREFLSIESCRSE